MTNYYFFSFPLIFISNISVVVSSNCCVRSSRTMLGDNHPKPQSADEDDAVSPRQGNELRDLNISTVREGDFIVLYQENTQLITTASANQK